MNGTSNWGVRAAAGAAFLLLANASAYAQATRTWVSGVGDDVNPCSRTAPCKTYAGAISKTAAGGIINTLDPGGFGALTITKSITIDGGGVAKGGTLHTSTNGVIVNAGASDVVRLRNLSIDGGNGVNGGINGIRFIAGGSLVVDNVRISGNSAAAPNGVGILFAPSGNSKLSVTDTIINNNVGGGIQITPGPSGFARAAIDNTRLIDNLLGLRADDRSMVSLRNSFVIGNDRNGILAFSTSQAVEITADNNQITNNGVGFSTSGGVKSQGPLASIVLSENVVSGNANGILVSGGGDVVSFGSNRVVSNDVDGSPTGTVSTR
jgi:hypothetical protein